MIHVTQKDIDAGCQNDPSYCPIAHAVRRQYPDWDVRVKWRQIYLKKDGGVTVARYRLPVDALIFITNFDTGDPVAPFSFEARRLA